MPSVCICDMVEMLQAFEISRAFKNIYISVSWTSKVHDNVSRCCFSLKQTIRKAEHGKVIKIFMTYACLNHIQLTLHNYDQGVYLGISLELKGRMHRNLYYYRGVCRLNALPLIALVNNTQTYNNLRGMFQKGSPCKGKHV